MGEKKKAELDDSQRAEQVGKQKYKIHWKVFVDLFNDYKIRKNNADEYVKDLKSLQDIGGEAGVLQVLETSLDKGINSLSREQRIKEFGTNEPEIVPRTTFWELMCDVLQDFMLQLLIVCAIFALITEMAFADADHRAYAWIEGTSILLAVAFVTVFTAASDYNKETQFIENQKIEHATQTVICRRDGNESALHKDHICVGDIVQVKGGMTVPVDGVLLTAMGDVQVDESAMTGESDHFYREIFDRCVQKWKNNEQSANPKYGEHDIPTPLILSGSNVTVGDGWMVIVVVGENTCEGQIMAGLAGKSKGNKLTPLQKKLNTIAEDIGKLGMFCAILIFHALILRNFIEGMVRLDFDLFGGERDPETGEKCSIVNGYRLKTDKTFKSQFALESQGTWTAYLADTKKAAKDQKWEISTAKIPVDTESELRNYCQGEIKRYVTEWFGNIITGVAIVVVAVPEGLPLAVMLSLAYSVKKMLEDKNFVKKLMACEIMGGANNICSDKTGTLTKNEMTWVQIWQGTSKEIKHPEPKPVPKKGEAEVTDAEWAKDDRSRADPMENVVPSGDVRKLILEGIAVNTSGDVGSTNATDQAFLKLFRMWGLDFIQCRRTQLPEDGNDLIRFAFDSDRKRMSTVSIPTGDAVPSTNSYNRRLHMKGGGEKVIPACTHFLTSDGTREPITDSVASAIQTEVVNFTHKALRVIVLAYKDLDQGECGDDHKDGVDNDGVYAVERDGFTLICIAGIKDVIRPEVPRAVKNCKTAGVRVRMVTGDNIDTAIAIAKECKIIDNDEDAKGKVVCMKGPDFFEYVGGLVSKKTGEEITIFGKDPDDERIQFPEKMKEVRDKLKVLARSRPNDKYVMVAGLRELGDIVAVTGDGTNDAPALKKADVGFAMQTGTQVAHAASDILIQDDNFASIVKACMWGRNVFDNIRRFLQFQLTVNVCALVVAFSGSVVLAEPPLAAIQFLWVNMIMDTLAALALATGLPTPELLDRPPYRRNEYIVNQKMTKHILGQTILQLFILFAFVFAAPKFVPEYQPEACKSLEFAYQCNDAEYWDTIQINQKYLKEHANEGWKKWDGKTVIDGTPKGFDGKPGYSVFKKQSYSRHMTTVFNIFVWFQIFNMICARKINDEFNIFAGILNNPLFILIWIVIGIGQWLMVQLAGRVFKVHQKGLTLEQWLYTTIPALLVFLFNILLKFVPDHICPQLGEEPEGEEDTARAEYKAIYVKPTRSISVRQSGRMARQSAGKFD